MRGADIIRRIGVNQIHCSVGKEMITLDQEYDYAMVRGTGEHPRIVCEHHEKLIEAGKYPRLRLAGKEILSDVGWTTGHNAFENEVEPRFSPRRPKCYMTE